MTFLGHYVIEQHTSAILSCTAAPIPVRKNNKGSIILTLLLHVLIAVDITAPCPTYYGWNEYSSSYD